MVTDDLRGFSACLWPVASESRDVLASVRRRAFDHGAATLTVATCQRIEVYSPALCECDAPDRRAGLDALLHLAEVAAGLHSVVLGEEQVLGQVREAIREAPAEVRPYVEAALAVARQFRREARLAADTGELLDRALALARVRPEGHLLVLGFGQMGRAVARRGAALGFAVTIAARRDPGPGALPGGLRYIPLAAAASLGCVDLVASCLGSGATPIDLPPLPRAPLAFDFGTPRNLPDDPGRRTVAIRDLAAAGRTPAELALRRRYRSRLAAILDRRLAMVRERSTSPVGQLRAGVEQRRQLEAERIRRHHPEIPPETIDTITRALVNHLFHDPCERLRGIADDEFGSRVAALFAPESHEGFA